MLKRALAALVLAVSLSLLAGPAHAGSYTPRPGPTFNSAVGETKARQAVNAKILNTIRSTPRGQRIQIMTWNFQTTAGVRALLQAQRRGVQVRLLMARGNSTRFRNVSFERLKAGLSQGNRGRKASRRSWARTCFKSCRGRGGAAHGKFYLFSKSGRARHVMIQGSANFTAAAANNQWNDLVTSVNKSGRYYYVQRIFNQMKRDKPMRRPLSSKAFGRDRITFMPAGRRSDPVMAHLNLIRCQGARNTRNGRTTVRIFPDAVREERGMRLARKIRSLWNAGCDVKVGYTLMGRKIGRHLTQRSGRGPVPLRHLVQDTNGDGAFDNYFHMKAMTVVGRIGGNRSGYLTMNGSANWSEAAIRSDENLAFYRGRAITLRYQEHMDYWYANLRTSFAPRSVVGRQALVSGRLSDDGLLFGTGPINGVDPYRNVAKD